MEKVLRLFEGKAAEESVLDQRFNEFDPQEAPEETLRSLENFVICDEQGNFLPIDELGQGKRAKAVGYVVEPLPFEWRKQILALSSSVPGELIDGESLDSLVCFRECNLELCTCSNSREHVWVLICHSLTLLVMLCVRDALVATDAVAAATPKPKKVKQTEESGSATPHSNSDRPFDRQQLDVGDTIDVYCVRTFTWYQSKVLEADENRLKVHFKGWNNKFDEWVERDSQRIEPLGTHTNEVRGGWRFCLLFCPA